MIEYTLDPVSGILHIRPKTSLEKADFVQLTGAIDPYIAGSGILAGLIIETPSFPGWSSFGAFAAHMEFVRDHHRQIGKIALVTDSALGNVAQNLVNHFVAAEIRQFPATELESARNWILNRP